MIGIASLRGLKDTTVPMWLAGFGYWVVGFPICWLLGFHTSLGGTGIWIGLAFALATVALVMVLRFERLTRRRGARRRRSPLAACRDRPDRWPRRRMPSRTCPASSTAEVGVRGLCQLPQAEQSGRRRC